MKQKGFTLIELVVVIVILGIMAVIAAPRFINLQADARASALQGLKAALDSSSDIAHAKAIIEGKESLSASSPTLDDGIALYFGYPSATSAGIGSAVNGLTEWEEVTPHDSLANSIAYSFPHFSSSDNCQVRYQRAAENNEPQIEVFDSGC